MLDGIFSECVVVVEADTDRLVYHTVLETLSDELRLDVHFAAVGGTGGLAGTCSLYRKLRIPVAIVADLDLIADPERLRRVLDVMASNDRAPKIMDEVAAVLEEIRKLPPSIEADEVAERLDAIAKLQTDWFAGDDTKICRKLNDLSDQLDRMRRLKRGGICALPAEIAAPLSELTRSFAEIGVFVVPVGELEEWLGLEGIAASKNNKWAWANEAALAVQTKGKSTGDVWDFMRKVGGYLATEH